MAADNPAPEPPNVHSRVEAVATLLRQAQALATELGVPNLFQPGIAKEMVIADALGHVLIPEKRQPDARDEAGNKYEYLSAIQGGSFQIDRLTEANLYRIERNAAIYCISFSKTEALKIEEIYRVETGVFLTEAKRQLKRSRNSISHIGVSPAWVKRNGTKVFPA